MAGDRATPRLILDERVAACGTELSHEGSGGVEMNVPLYWLAVILTGLAAGTVSALLGIGSGILVVPLLILVWGKDPHAAVGTALGLMIFLAAAGVLRHHFSYKTVDWVMALQLAIGGVVGAFFIGAPLSNAIKSETLVKLFGALLIILGLKMLGVGGYVMRLFGLSAGGPR
jgi:uncharacterized membrane protein YfcA